MKNESRNLRRKSKPEIVKHNNQIDALRVMTHSNVSAESATTELIPAHVNSLQPKVHSTPAENMELLHRFVHAHPDFIVGDDMGTSCLCIQTVLMASLILDTRSIQVIAYATRYPEVFVSAVFNEFERLEVSKTHVWVEMVIAFAEKLEDFDEMNAWIEAVGEHFWKAFWSPEAQIALDSLRGRFLFGGGLQTWIDEDAAERFGLELTTA